MNFIKNLKSEYTITQKSGRQKHNLYIKDCIKILTESINNNRLKKNDIINLSSGQRFTVKELIKQILLASGKKKYEIN